MTGTAAPRNRHAADPALRMGDARLKDFLALFSDWYWEQDEEHRFTLLVGAALERMGVDSRALVGTTRQEAGAIPGSGSWAEHGAALAARQPFTDVIFKYPSAPGHVSYVSISGEPVFDEQGRFAGYRGTGRDVSHRVHTDLRLTIEHAVTRILEESNAIADATPKIIGAICGTLGWACGARWETAEDGQTIACAGTWGSGSDGIETFLEASRTQSHSLQIGGLTRRAWTERRPLWIPDVTREASFRRAPLALAAGLHSAFAFPIKTRLQTVGVMEFFSHEIHQPDPELLDCMTYVGSQIGQFIQRKQVEEELREREERFRAVVESANEGIVVYDRSQRVIAANTAAARILGIPRAQMIGALGFTSLLACVHEDGSELAPDERPTSVTVRSGKPLTGQILGIKRPDGAITWVSVNTGLMCRPGESDYFGIVSTIGDITQQRQAEAALRRSEEKFRSLTALSSDLFWEQDAEFRFTSFSGAESGKLTFAEVKRLLGKTCRELEHVNMAEEDWASHRALLAARAPFRDLELCYVDALGNRSWISSSGEPVFDVDGRFCGYRGVGKNITARKADEEQIHYLANHDALTSLPNRAMFTRMLNMAIDGAQRYDRRFAVLFIDLDRFKFINDTLGHGAGDELLQHLGLQLGDEIRSSDVVARLGGDEFVVLVQEVSDVRQVEAVARKILAALSRPLTIQNRECRVTASIGISMFSCDGDDEQSLMKNADVAMYRAKEEGKNNYRFYSKDLNTHPFERLALETSLRRGLERNEFFLQYQPKLDLHSRRITGVEALVRWQHPDLGVVSPAQFIPLAEETGLIVAIGRWVLNTACVQNVRWQEMGLPPLRMAVNLSARQFAHERLIPDITAALKASAMPPALLELELTESMVVQDGARAGKMLNAIKQLGVRIAIDDFGVGYSSLAQLKRFPIDTLKIDQSFIRDLPHDVEDRAITQAIISMGKSLHLTVIAEGVETAEQEQFLRDLTCDESQGYYFSRPVSAEALVDLLRAQNELAKSPDQVAGPC